MTDPENARSSGGEHISVRDVPSRRDLCGVRANLKLVQLEDKIRHDLCGKISHGFKAGRRKIFFVSQEIKNLKDLGTGDRDFLPFDHQLLRLCDLLIYFLKLRLPHLGSIAGLLKEFCSILPEASAVLVIHHGLCDDII